MKATKLCLARITQTKAEINSKRTVEEARQAADVVHELSRYIVHLKRLFTNALKYHLYVWIIISLCSLVKPIVCLMKLKVRIPFSVDPAAVLQELIKVHRDELA